MNQYKKIRETDKVLSAYIQEESHRQKYGLEMIPSENYVSDAVLEAMGSILTNKYSEGYPGKRYYGGNEFIDKIELLTKERAEKLFKTVHANVQPYSGSPANLAVYLATCQPGDTVMGLDLTHGGHLTHGWKVSATGIFFNTVMYHVTREGRVDFNEVKELVKKFKPKLIWTGATAYVYQYEFDKFAEIADSCGAYFAADIAHTAGLVIGGAHLDPSPFAHIITTTTHKTLRGPRGGMIMVTKKGVKKDPDLPQKVDKAVFPGLQGGPHDHTTAAIALALKEAEKASFKVYAKLIVKNSQALARQLIKNGLKLVGNGTENHMVLMDLIPVFGPGGGFFAQYALDRVGITLNKNTIPGEPMSPFYPSGVRLGTPALTTRGLKEKDLIRVADWIGLVLNEVTGSKLPGDKDERKDYLENYRRKVDRSANLGKIKKEINHFAGKFPIFAWNK
ncbi:MAG: glycine hydroxymethyltransferase, glycine hydroxymethyltransferase [Candidatus Gottesmanbacteria bacterium GW2011_GWA2_43_14]|uniref:Serine hydroxymethyltransferase n=1 Tax=Candidatus Gottesmanbacteria bacterium GW2011_GWA2_43_14 TaxID=1618443 RepID=A0A0G1DLE5_9BACT|nr:MAG: glycine hydroxymethyltransferase, glycine hydroxymethyltransferase [Candidatus Gottesmanbacteria bacterium GW2011_GWA2_43_14]